MRSPYMLWQICPGKVLSVGVIVFSYRHCAEKHVIICDLHNFQGHSRSLIFDTNR